MMMMANERPENKGLNLAAPDEPGILDTAKPAAVELRTPHHDRRAGPSQTKNAGSIASLARGVYVVASAWLPP